MRLSVLYVVLFMGVAALGRPEGESSPVANPASVSADDTAAAPLPAAPAEDEEAARPKRWNGLFWGQFEPNYGFPTNYNFQDMHAERTFNTPVSGRTGSNNNDRYGASINELLHHQRMNDEVYWRQPQEWMPNQQGFGQQNLPDVIDTSAPGFNNFNNVPFNQGFDSNPQGRTGAGFPEMRTSGTGHVPVFNAPGWNNQGSGSTFPPNYSFGYNGGFHPGFQHAHY